jgi:hypothetical protein
VLNKQAYSRERLTSGGPSDLGVGKWSSNFTPEKKVWDYEKY